MATKTHQQITAQTRKSFGNQNRALRRTGLIPANIFGHGEPTPIQIDAETFRRLREKHQTTGIIDLLVDGRTEPVVVRHIDHQPSSGKVLHVDFLRVRMNEKLKAHVPLRLEGESPAAKLSKGVVLTLLESVEVEGLPDSLPDAVTLDLAKLTDVHAILHASDIAVPAGVTLLTSPEEPVAKVQVLHADEADTPAPAATTETTA